MRDIKFIAFDKYFKKLVNVNKIDFSLKNARVLPFDKITPDAIYKTSLDNLELMQYTGLKDKNGVEIYDGDIVRWGMGGLELSGVRYAEVELFPSLSFKLRFYEDEKTGKRKPPSRPYSFDFSNFIYTNTEKYLEVIGNIYENKELLNVQ